MFVLIASVVGLLAGAAATGGWPRLVLAMAAACMSAATVAHAAAEPVPVGPHRETDQEDRVIAPVPFPSVRAG